MKTAKMNTVRKFISMVLILAICTPAFADRSILLVTPQGIYKAEVVNGVPGQFLPVDYDVVIQGFGNGGGTKPVPPSPPVSDAEVQQVATISQKVLKDKTEATAVAALVDALSKLGLTGKAFKDALEMAAPIADSSMRADNRIILWAKQCLAVTTDPAKLKAGVNSAFNVTQASLDVIYTAAQQPEGTALPEEALDVAAIIMLIQTIIKLLQNLGII